MNKWTLLCVQDREGKTKTVPEVNMDCVYVISSVAVGNRAVLTMLGNVYSTTATIEYFEYVRDYLVITTAETIYTFELYFEDERAWY